MNIFYDVDIDWLEIFFESAPNCAYEIDDYVSEFRREKDDKVIGYLFEDASQSVFESNILSLQAKIAILLKIIRSKEKLTQEQAAEKIGRITLRHYQRLESGEENTTISVIESIMHAFPKEDFSKIFKRVG